MMRTALTDATAAAVVAPGAQAGTDTCSRCGGPLGGRRRSAAPDDSLCLGCRQRERRAAYFRLYYETHRDRILDKNRKWARDNRDKLVQLRQARQGRQAKLDAAPRRCVECGAAVVRATRCRRCYMRFRYSTDPDYRARRLATTRRWLDRRQQARPPETP